MRKTRFFRLLGRVEPLLELRSYCYCVLKNGQGSGPIYIEEYQAEKPEKISLRREMVSSILVEKMCQYGNMLLSGHVAC